MIYLGDGESRDAIVAAGRSIIQTAIGDDFARKMVGAPKFVEGGDT